MAELVAEAGRSAKVDTLRAHKRHPAPPALGGVTRQGSSPSEALPQGSGPAFGYRPVHFFDGV